MFDHFFRPCEQGFKNEFIINMLARIRDKNSLVQQAGKKFRELYFIREGAVGIYDSNGKGPYVILPQYSFFGDYQTLFELKSVYNYKTYVRYDRTKSPTDNEKVDSITVFMCIDKKVFMNLCELYPKTASNLRFRGLERRQAMLNQFSLYNRLKMSRKESKVGKKTQIQSKLCKMIEMNAEHVEPPTFEQPDQHLPTQATSIDIDKVVFAPDELNENDKNCTGDEIESAVKSLNEQVKSLNKLKRQMQTQIAKKRSEQHDSSLISLDKYTIEVDEVSDDQEPNTPLIRGVSTQILHSLRKFQVGRDTTN